MAPSMSEAAVESPPETEDETAATTSTEEAKSAAESSKKKKKKKKDMPTTTESQKATDDSDNGKDTESKVDNDTSKTEGEGATEKEPNTDVSAGPVVSVTKRTRPPYKYDPEKVTLRFLFANRDGLTVTVECKPSDTVGEVKGQLLSVWPEDLQSCTSGDQLRLICMGKGMLIPDTRTLQDCEVPVFKTHPTPVNVAVRPINIMTDASKSGKDGGSRGGGASGGSNHRTTEQSGQGCGCVIS